MTEDREHRPAFLPALWAEELLDAYRAQPGLMAAWAAQERARDEALRRDHPWRWRALHTRRWFRSLRGSVARATPVRWVGFGHDWGGWWEP